MVNVSYFEQCPVFLVCRADINKYIYSLYSHKTFDKDPQNQSRGSMIQLVTIAGISQIFLFIKQKYDNTDGVNVFSCDLSHKFRN